MARWRPCKSAGSEPSPVMPADPDPDAKLFLRNNIGCVGQRPTPGSSADAELLCCGRVSIGPWPIHLAVPLAQNCRALVCDGLRRALDMESDSFRRVGGIGAHYLL